MQQGRQEKVVQPPAKKAKQNPLLSEINKRFETMQKETVHVSQLIEPAIKVGQVAKELESSALKRKKKKESRRDRAIDFEGGASDDSGDNVLNSGAVSEADSGSNDENKLQEKLQKKLQKVENVKKEEEEVDDEDSIDPIFEADDDEEDFQEPPKIGHKREGEQMAERKNKKQKTN